MLKAKQKNQHKHYDVSILLANFLNSNKSNIIFIIWIKIITNRMGVFCFLNKHNIQSHNSSSEFMDCLIELYIN